MTSRISTIDLCVQLVQLQYGKIDTLEQILELLNIEFPDDKFTMSELQDWEIELKQYEWEKEELERYLGEYEETRIPDRVFD